MKTIQFYKTCTSIILLVMAFSLTSLRSTIETYTFEETIDVKNLKKLHADLVFGAGKLIITAHNQPSATIASTFTRKNWKPEVKLDQSGNLSIHQPSEKNLNMKDKDKNEWDIKLPKNLITDFKLKMGAGEGIIDLNGSKINKMEVEAGAGDFTINLANSAVNSLNVSAGVGALTIDLSGKHENNLNANIKGGIGEIKIMLPIQMGIRVKVSGVGSIGHNDLTKQDGFYVNDLYGKTSENIDLNVKGGLGSLSLILQ